MTPRNLICRVSLSLCACLAVSAVQAARTNAFFVMDTAMRDGKERTPAEQAGLVKELGYEGFGTSGYVSEEFLVAFEKQGLKVYNTYLTLDFDAGHPGLKSELKEAVARFKGHGTDLWVALNGVTRDGVKLKPSDPAGDSVVAPPLRELADLAKASGLRVALYPHTWFWMQRVEDALRVARCVDRSNVGATFNLCHWLKVEGDRDPVPVLKDGMPLLFFVTINGADQGDTKSMNWDKLIQPLDAGTYDVAGLLKALRGLGYTGAIGFQGYGIPGDSREILSRTQGAWKRMNAP